MVAKPAISRPVLSTSTRGDATVLAPVSLASFRMSHSNPADRRGSRTPANTPDLVRGNETPTGPICPVPPATKVLATAPTYVHPVNANVLITLSLEPDSGVIESRA